MGLIIKKLRIEGDKGTYAEEVLFDTGARFSAIHKDRAEVLASFQPLSKAKVFGVAKKNVSLKATQVVLLNIELNGVSLDGSFYVLENLRRKVVIGADFMQKWDIKLFPRDEKLTVGVNPEEIEFF